MTTTTPRKVTTKETDMRIGSAADLASEGGTFVSPESGARGDAVMASYEYVPEVFEEEERIGASDPLRRRKLSNQVGRSPFSQTITENGRWGTQSKVQFRGDSAYWPMNSAGVDLDQLGD